MIFAAAPPARSISRTPIGTILAAENAVYLLAERLACVEVRSPDLRLAQFWDGAMGNLTGAIRQLGNGTCKLLK
jgi:hypothetical protein